MILCKENVTVALIRVKTKNKVDIDKKPRVYFTCHPDDFEKYFDKICNDILNSHDCAIYYTKNMSEQISNEDKETDLGRSNLFVIPISVKLLTTPNRAIDEDVPYALREHIPILPIMMTKGAEELYSNSQRFGELQYLDPNSTDLTEIPYAEKLKKHLESILIDDETAQRIRIAFDAYIFLSYRKKDRKYANELMRLIHRNPIFRDIAIWFDEFLTPGESFKENIERILNDCRLFTLLVTPQLLEKVIDESGAERDNYVIGVELPLAQRNRLEKGVEIFAVEMEKTDANSLAKIGIFDFVNPKKEDVFYDQLLTYFPNLAISSSRNTPEHNFLIGLAYLEGIDVEVNRERAVALIKESAELGLPEAIAELILMYTDGIGVSRSQSEALKWSEKLSDYYYKKVFSKKGTIKSKNKLSELFAHYRDKYWENTIEIFLLKADKSLPFILIQGMYDHLMSIGICEYTLFFKTSKKMSQYQEETQILLITDILKKSVSGTYPPYGPLFWYVPEYNLYEIVLLALEQMKKNDMFAKMLALSRDVCWIFGQKNNVVEVSNRINGPALYEKAKQNLSGIRNALCELFYIGETSSSEGTDIYPRCFNVGEVISLKNTGIGLWKRMSTPFEDELGLYEHCSYNELNGELIGFVSCPYHKPNIERLFNEKNIYKVRGLALTPTINIVFTYLSIYRRNISIIYFPENCIKKSRDSLLQMDLIYENYLSETHMSYIKHQSKIVIPGHLIDIVPFAFAGFDWVEEIVFLDGIQSIGQKAFQGCDHLSKIVFPRTLKEIKTRLFLCFSLKSIVVSKSTYPLIEERFEKKTDNICDVIKLDDEWLEIIVSNNKEGKSTHSVTLKDDSGSHRGLRDVKAKNSFLYNWTFEGDRDIQNVKLPSRMREIFPRTFKDCISLTNIMMPNDLEIIGKSAFEGCKALYRIFLPETLKIISDMAFLNCTNLKKVFLPNNLLNIGYRAFANCTMLQEIQLPPSLVFIAPNTFDGCSSLRIIRVPIDFALPLAISKTVEVKYYQPHFVKTQNYNMITAPNDFESQIVNITSNITNEIYINAEKPLSKNQFAEDEKITSVVIDEGITDIPKYCFSGCINLHTVKLPSTITRISSGAFINCYNLTNIDLPFGLRSINESAFANCKKLRQIHFSKNLLQIGGQAFCGCTSLESIELPSTLRRVGARSFLDCRSLKQISISANFCEDLERIFGNIDLSLVRFLY